MSEITIKKMRKDALVRLIEDTINDMNSINSAIEKINSCRNESIQANNEINGDDGFLIKIQNASNEIDQKLEQIKLASAEIYEDSENNESIKTQLENLVTAFEKNQKQIKEFKNEIWGYEKSKEDGTKEKVEGLFDNINDFHEKQKIKYDELYGKIEKELLPGATAVRLAKVFESKVSEYAKKERIWSIFFIVLILLTTIYYGAITFFVGEAKTLEAVWLHLLFRLPFLAFVIWLAIFFGNRRAESKKLEESYKHKEVMARAFTGYKESIKELDDEDQTLLKIHMNNLLNTMNIDSGDFLDSKGEKHPIQDFLGRLGIGGKDESK